MVIGLSFVFYAIHTFALLRSTAQGTGTIDTASWSVTRSQSQPGDSLEVIPGLTTDDYTLTVALPYSPLRKTSPASCGTLRSGDPDTPP